jgi:hypothetical protein
MSDQPTPDLEAAINLPTPARILWLLDHVEQLKGEVERLRGLLRELQWAGTHCDGYRETAACPVCDVPADSPVFGLGVHLPDCWLAAEVRAAIPPDPEDP